MKSVGYGSGDDEEKQEESDDETKYKSTIEWEYIYLMNQFRIVFNDGDVEMFFAARMETLAIHHLRELERIAKFDKDVEQAEKEEMEAQTDESDSDKFDDDEDEMVKLLEIKI
ncbi:hypothetical protein L1987_58052 [Smallanthus sonchifolius]|uniref:Uncharacterized protein n=1 Tax=Smallanthus sonchifolius TaxID=185202 RepID=A0ACB9DE69_9ASTR|nr:hypothetical protein L1987_58052 [Smallanthus sonchifolius]